MNNDEASSCKIHIIYFRDKTSTLSDQIVCELENTLDCDVHVCLTIEELLRGISHIKKTLVLVSSTVFTDIGISPVELKNMVSVIQKLSAEPVAIHIAIVIECGCTSLFLKNLQLTGILGVVPGVEKFGFTATLEALTTLVQHKEYWPKALIAQLTDIPEKRRVPRISSTLTARQTQVLDLIQNRGLSNKAIGKMLNITEGAVKVHIGHLLKIYGVKNRTQLAVLSTE